MNTIICNAQISLSYVADTKDYIKNVIEDIKIIDITDKYNITIAGTNTLFKVLYYPNVKKVEIIFTFDNLNLEQNTWHTLAQLKKQDDFVPVAKQFSIGYGSGAQFLSIMVSDNSSLQFYNRDSGMVSGNISFIVR